MDDPPESRRRTSYPTVTTSEELRNTLTRVIAEAETNGVDVRGRWSVSRDDDRRWDVEVTETNRRTTARTRDMEHTISVVTEAITEREGVETTDLPPLHDAMPAEVLELLYEFDDAGAERHVRFQYCGYWITVRSDGSVAIDE